MEGWKGIIAAIEYMIMYEKSPQDDVGLLANAIRSGGHVAFTIDEIAEALKCALNSEDDLSEILLIQKHSDEVLRETFRLLSEQLS